MLVTALQLSSTPPLPHSLRDQTTACKHIPLRVSSDRAKKVLRESGVPLCSLPKVTVGFAYFFLGLIGHSGAENLTGTPGGECCNAHMSRQVPYPMDYTQAHKGASRAANAYRKGLGKKSPATERTSARIAEPRQNAAAHHGSSIRSHRPHRDDETGGRRHWYQPHRHQPTHSTSRRMDEGKATHRRPTRHYSHPTREDVL